METENESCEAKIVISTSVDNSYDLLDRLQEGCQVIGCDWRFLYVNDAAVKQGKTTRSMLLGKTMMEAYPGIEKTPLFSQLERCMKERVPIRMENDFIHRNGEKTWFELSIQPVSQGVLILSTDISERKEAEENVEKSADEWSRTFDAIPDYVLVLDKDLRIRKVNKAILDALASKPEEIIGRHCFEALHGTDAPFSGCPCEEICLTREKSTKEMGNPKSGTFTLATASPIFDKKGEFIGIVHTHRDITERKKMEETLQEYSDHLEELVDERTAALRESERKYAVVAEEASDGIIILQDRKLVFANKKATEMAGYLIEEMVDSSFTTLLSETSRQLEQERCEHRIRRKNVPSVYEVELVAKTGITVPVELNCTPIQYRGRSAELIIMRDIAKRKQLEEQRLRLGKLASLGEAATWVGHDLRNPLQVIKNATYVLKRMIPQGPNTSRIPAMEKAKRMIEIIDDAVTYADHIVLDLRDFSAASKPLHRQADLNTIINEVLKTLKVHEGVTVDKQFEKVPLTSVDVDHIKRVFQNLAENAVQAMRNGGTLTVVSGEKKGVVEVEFKDTGTGISKENLGKVFTPFFTTKAQGMGLGLAICKKFVEEHGGTITVESQEGKGAIFVVKLPIRNDEVKH